MSQSGPGSPPAPPTTKKGDDILVLDVAEIMGIVECFVITGASNTRLVRAIVDEIEMQIHRADR